MVTRRNTREKNTMGGQLVMTADQSLHGAREGTKLRTSILPQTPTIKSTSNVLIGTSWERPLTAMQDAVSIIKGFGLQKTKEAAPQNRRFGFIRLCLRAYG